MSSIVWFRQDLRIEDHPALSAAIQKGQPILPLYIYAPHEERDWPLGGASRWWLHHSLKSLSKQLSSLGLTLVIRAGNSQAILDQMIDSTDATSIYWNCRYEPAARQIESNLTHHLRKRGINVQNFHSNLLFEPGSVLNRHEKPFTVFTHFWKACLAMQAPHESMPRLLKKNIKNQPFESLPLEVLELLPKIHWDEGIKARWKPGALQAKKLLNDFIKEDIYHYEEKRNRPDLSIVSHLSPYLHFGEISPHMIWSLIQKKCDLSHPSVQSYLRQLGWREFAYHLLYHFPKTAHEPLKSEFSQFPWHENAEYLKAWQKGKTGYPIVDAGMRQLWTTGWMHNRLRLIVGSFLVKDLLIPWQQGAEWFWDTLVDADLANNTLGWQWVGGCGADAAPYFRIFNPVIQGEKYDPKGVFVRQWIPEIAALPDDWIHRPWEAPQDILKKCKIILGETYPYPIVDHKRARQLALDVFHCFRAKDHPIDQVHG